MKMYYYLYTTVRRMLRLISPLLLLCTFYQLYLTMCGGGMFEIIQNRPDDTENERQKWQSHGGPRDFRERYDNANLRHVLHS